MKYKLEILGTTWTLEVCKIPMIDDNKSTEDYGQTNFDKALIRISTKNDPFKHLIHEILEVLKDNLKLELSHDDLERLEHGLSAALRDNQAVISKFI